MATRCPICGSEIGDSSICGVCGTAIANSDRTALPLGTMVGRYQVSGVLGQGGFGITYFGMELSTRQPVAIKELFPDGCIRVGNTVQGRTGFFETRRQFAKEAQAMKALPRHPSIAEIYELVEDNGTEYLVMEFIEGVTSEFLLSRNSRGLDEARVVAWVRQLADALDTVHAVGLLHRDVKPNNIMISPAVEGRGERAVLIDFGSAREFKAAETSQMTAMVTRGYAPLEQYGKDPHRFGPQVDVYALGATMYHLLSGTAPPESPDRVYADPLLPLERVCPTVSGDTAAAVAQALKMSVADRTPTMEIFVGMLDGDSGMASSGAGRYRKVFGQQNETGAVGPDDSTAQEGAYRHVFVGDPRGQSSSTSADAEQPEARVVSTNAAPWIPRRWLIPIAFVVAFVVLVVIIAAVLNSPTP